MLINYIKSTCKKLSRSQWSRIITVRYPAPNNRNGDTIALTFGRKFSQFEMGGLLHRSLARQLVLIISEEISTPFSCLHLSRKAMKWSRKCLREAWEPFIWQFPGTAMVYNFLSVAKTVSRVRLDYRFAPYCLRSQKYWSHLKTLSIAPRFVSLFDATPIRDYSRYIPSFD